MTDPAGRRVAASAGRPGVTGAATGDGNARWVPAFVALAAVWGCSFLFIKVGLRAFSPVQVALVRCTLGACLLLGAVRARGLTLPRRPPVWGHLFVMAVLLNSVPFTLFGLGEQRVSSALAGIVNAATPLAAVIAATAVFRDERPTSRQAAGLLVGFSGVAVTVGAWRGMGGADLRGAGECLLAACCYGLSFPYARRHLSRTGLVPVQLAAGQMVCASAQLAPFFAVGGAPDRPGRPTVVLAMLALGFLGSGLAYVLNYLVIERAGPSTAASVTYAMPVVAVVAGASVLGEPVRWNQPAGAAVILAGVALARGPRRATGRRGEPPPGS